MRINHLAALLILAFCALLNPGVAQAQSHHYAEDWAQYAPLAAYEGLGFISGVRHKHNFGERLLCGATAYAIMGGTAYGLKKLVNERRPDGSDCCSFPSGHAAKAFVGAELMRLEYGWVPGLCGYAFATGIAVLRVTHHRHYAHDALAGAAIGVLSANVANWILPWECKLLGLKDSRTQVAIAPQYDVCDKAVGLAAHIEF